MCVVKKFLASDRGATAIEYALIASLISIAIIGSILIFENEMTKLFQYISGNIGPSL
jgi:pilus assembly protein Flp/PilA